MCNWVGQCITRNYWLSLWAPAVTVNKRARFNRTPVNSFILLIWYRYFVELRFRRILLVQTRTIRTFREMAGNWWKTNLQLGLPVVKENDFKFHPNWFLVGLRSFPCFAVRSSSAHGGKIVFFERFHCSLTKVIQLNWQLEKINRKIWSLFD